jgi:hypothetical protein
MSQASIFICPSFAFSIKPSLASGEIHSILPDSGKLRKSHHKDTKAQRHEGLLQQKLFTLRLCGDKGISMSVIFAIDAGHPSC